MQRRPHLEPGKFKPRAFLGLIAKIKPHYWQLGLGLILGMIATGFQLAVPHFAKNLINEFGHSVNTGIVIALISAFILSAIVSAFSGAVLGFFGEDVVYKLRELLWNKLLKLPVSYFDETKSGEITSRLVNDSTQVKNLLANSVPSLVTSLLQLVGSFVIMLVMNWKMTVIMFVTVPVVVLAIRPVMKQSRKIGRTRQDLLADFNGGASETLSEVRLVKSSTAEKVEQTSGFQQIKNLYNIGIKEAIYDSISGPIMTMMMMGMMVAMLAYGANQVAHGIMDIGTLFSFLMYLFQMIGPVATIGQFFNTTAKTGGSTERITELMDVAEEDQHSGEPLNMAGQDIHMEDVDFAYDKDEPILKDVTFKAKPNTTVAFAGPSGGGKSTIFALLERFYEPDSGAVTLGNVNAKDINLFDWRKQIGLVSQDAAIMSGIIRYNLTYGLPDKYTDDQLWNVLKMAYADEFVKAMPKGLDTQVGERGVKLSGGQRQRIAIARAFLRDLKILMLDEATASLDSESEMMVQKDLEKLMHGRTTLVIAHRLSTIVDADQIYFIDHGSVSGHGTHEQLVQELPLYKEYVENQFGKIEKAS